MKREKIFLSTIDPKAGDLARELGLGVEIAEYCTAWNMDREFPQTDAGVRQQLEGNPRRILHGPFNELFPCAIDPQARELAALRYRQAIGLARDYGAGKVVLHAGFNPWLYYPEWFREQSAEFWRDFLMDDPGVELVLENVLEQEPEWITDILRAVDSPRLRLCLDVGHVNAYSPVGAAEWLRRCAPWISHFHLHNNNGTRDAHDPLFRGSIPMEELLTLAGELCPEATFTLELPDAENSARELMKLIDN
ncbi:MAG: sugar phosphate isomerase/epimerase family protein [Faecousia sp.]